MNKLKYVTLNAVLILGLLPVASTIAAVETVHADELSATTRQNSGMASLLDDKLKREASISIDDLNGHASVLADIVNQESNEAIISGYPAGPKNVALAALFKAILKVDDSSFTLQSLTNQISRGQLVINGKTAITAEEIKSSERLIIEFKLFSLGSTAPSISQPVTLNVKHYSAINPDLVKKVTEVYNVRGDLKVKDPEGLEITDYTIKIAGTNTELMSDAKPGYLIEAGLIDAGTGKFINEGSYVEKFDIYVGDLLVKANVERTLEISIGDAQPSFEIRGGKYDSDSTITNTSHFLTPIEGDSVDSLEASIKRVVLDNIKVSDMNVNVSATSDYSALTAENSVIEAPVVFDLSKTATYKVKVTYKKAGSNITSVITVPVIVKAATAPVIRFTQGQNLTIPVGTSFDLAKNIKVYENKVATVEGQNVVWKVDGAIDTATPGVYRLRYIATNPKGLSTELTRIITVEGKATEKPTIEKFVSVGYVNYVPGYGIRVWGEPQSNGSDRVLAHGTAWKIDQKATMKDGSVWYRVGTNQWVDAQYVSLTPINEANEENVSGVATINYVEGYSVNVYSSPASSSASWTGKQLKHGTKWLTYKRATVNGKTFYNLGGSQWVDSQYITFSAN
ncbi:immunoglobulin-like domain-containing protein [Carnobacterium maltaromaticum]